MDSTLPAPAARNEASPPPFFSIVVPCCDVAPYVTECFESVLSQSFGDWEILAGVETSSDATEDIVRSFAGRDPRFRVFTGPRSGSCSVPRNRGIALARGTYVLFLDGDDCLAPDALQRLRGRMAERPGADIYIGSLRKFRHGTGDTLTLIDNYPAGLVREMTGAEATFLQSSSWPTPMLQLAAFRLGFLRDTRIACLEGVRAQDIEFYHRAIYLARRVIPLHEEIYLYRYRADSVQSFRTDRLDRFYDDQVLIFRSLLAFYADVSRKEGFDRRVAAFWARCWIGQRIAQEWFRPACLASVPRVRRVDTLRALFAGGFGTFDALRRAGGPKTRLAGWWIKVFVLHPCLRGCAEWFFRAYAVLNRLKLLFRKRPVP